MRKRIKRTADPEQVDWCKKYLQRNKMGQRGEFDGDTLQQLFGLQAQVIICDLLGHQRPLEGEGFDGGYDVMLEGQHYDVKCCIRDGNFKPSKYCHNLKASQLRYKQCEGYIFVSYNKANGEFTICGCIEKEVFKHYARHYVEGIERPRTDGTTMTVKGTGGMYELKDGYLEEIPFKETAEDLQQGMFHCDGPCHRVLPDNVRSKGSPEKCLYCTGGA